MLKDVKQNKVVMCEQTGNLSREVDTKKEWDENFSPENISEIKNGLD